MAKITDTLERVKEILEALLAPRNPAQVPVRIPVTNTPTRTTRSYNR